MLVALNKVSEGIHKQAVDRPQMAVKVCSDQPRRPNHNVCRNRPRNVTSVNTCRHPSSLLPHPMQDQPRKPDMLPDESHSELPQLPQANGLHQAHLTSPLFYCKPFPPLHLPLSVCQTQVTVATPLLEQLGAISLCLFSLDGLH